MIKLMQVGFGQWAFLFGRDESTSLTDCSLIAMGEWGKVFQSREIAEWAAQAQGMVVEVDGLVAAA